MSAGSCAISGIVTTAVGAGVSMGCAGGEGEVGQVRSQFLAWYTRKLRFA